MKVKWLMGVIEGQRVLVTRDLDFTPFFEVKKGQRGTVNFVNYERGTCSVLMDDKIEGCLDNEVFFNIEGAAMPHSEWHTLELVCWPLPSSAGRNEHG